MTGTEGTMTLILACGGMLLAICIIGKLLLGR